MSRANQLESAAADKLFTAGFVVPGKPFGWFRRSWIFVALTSVALTFEPSVFCQDSICARVKIEILQELTLERQAFEARMVINNGLTGVPLIGLGVNVTFGDASGNSVRASSDPNDLTAKFFIRLQTGSTIPASIPGDTSSTITWLIIPAPGSANANPNGTLYSVGATLSYYAAGVSNSVVVSPDTIYVKPMPNLTLDYFLPSEVYGDDPFTDNVIESVVPFNLGVRVKNTGLGVARNLAIESAQPRIVENKQGLLVNFQISGSEVNGRPATASLLANFGDISPNRSGVARWIMTSSLSGRFLDFTANYTHSDELGGQLTSLIAAQPTTHLLLRDVLVDLPGRDAIRDFLAQDGNFTRVYESENLDSSVANLSTNSAIASAAGGRYQVTTTPSTGFSFIKLSDPLNGNQTVHSATRGDGKVLNPANFWQSQTWDNNARQWNHFVNLFDVNNTAGLPYTLDFVPSGPTTNRPPVLDPINNWVINPGNFLSFAITGFDPDGNHLSFSMSGAPTNATLDSTTGLFQWRPRPFQAGTSNFFQVTVADDGSPALSATRGFSVVVRPLERFQLTLGRTNIFTGESNTVPLVLKSDVGLTNVSWQLTTTGGGGLTNLELRALSPEVFGYTLTQIGANRYALSLEVDAQRVQFSTRQLALLGFQTLPVAHSAIVPLPVENLLGTDSTGRIITNGVGGDGRVIVYAREPVLEANPDKTLTLYGQPGNSYGVEFRPTTETNAAWSHVQNLPLTNRFGTLPVTAPSPMSFYRAYEFQASPPLMETPAGGSPLLVYGRPGFTYRLERALTNNNQLAWINVTDFRLLNSWRFVEVPTNATGSVLRVVENAVQQASLELVGNSTVATTLRLYGKPGATYVIEARTQLKDDVAWVPALSMTLTNAVQTFTWTNALPASRFFRAVENGLITPPFLAPEGAKDNLVKLRLQGLAGAIYLIEGNTNAAAPLSWQPVQRVMLTNSSQSFAITNAPGAARVFRAKVD